MMSKFRTKRVLALLLAAIMAFSTPLIALADEGDEIVEAKATQSEIVLEATAEDGMKVTLKADVGAFEYAENLSLEATVVTEEVAEEASEELKEETKDDNVAKRVTYDIKVMHDGEAIQPVDGKKVKVEFTMAEVPSGADAVSVYHHNEETEKIETIIDDVPVNADEKAIVTEVTEEDLIEDGDLLDDVTVAGETESFSLYTVDFTYDEKTVSISGDSDHNKLTDILAGINITEEIEDAKAYQDAAFSVAVADGIVKNDEGIALFKVYNEEGTWYVDALNAFQTEHGLIVKTIDSAEYQIKVTDLEPTEYKIKYNILNGVVDPPNPATYSSVSETFTLRNPTREGYTFTGWTGTGISEATKSVTIPTGSTGDREYTASYSHNVYKLTVNKGIGIATVSGAGTYDFLKKVTVVATVCDGYRFKAWIDKNGKIQSTSIAFQFDMRAEDIELTATAVPVITVTADSCSKPYDSTPLTSATYSYTGNLKSGDELEVTVSGSITDFGTVANVITSCKITRGGVDIPDEYKIVKVPGTLSVTKRQITLTSNSASKPYDGTALTCNTVNVSGEGFAGIDEAEYTVTGSQTDVGSSPNTFTYELKGGAKETNYDITKQYGTLTVTGLYSKDSSGGAAWTSSPTVMGSATNPISNGAWVPVNDSYQYVVNGEPLKHALTWISYIPAGQTLPVVGCFYFDKNGIMATGWHMIDGAWQYFDPVAGPTQGMMKANCWVETNGKLYYLGADRKMLVNTTTPDGKRVGADGALVQ